MGREFPVAPYVKANVGVLSALIVVPQYHSGGVVRVREGIGYRLLQNALVAKPGGYGLRRFEIIFYSPDGLCLAEGNLQQERHPYYKGAFPKDVQHRGCYKEQLTAPA
jgi:hypothetical protein